MKRWIVSNCGRTIGQSTSWHKALDLAVRQLSIREAKVTIFSREYIHVQPTGLSAIIIQLEHLT